MSIDELICELKATRNFLRHTYQVTALEAVIRIFEAYAANDAAGVKYGD